MTPGKDGPFRNADGWLYVGDVRVEASVTQNMKAGFLNTVLLGWLSSNGWAGPEERKEWEEAAHAEVAAADKVTAVWKADAERLAGALRECDHSGVCIDCGGWPSKHPCGRCAALAAHEKAKDGR